MANVPEISISSGRKIPVIGQGLMLFSDPNADSAEVAYQGLKAGFRLLDTAQAYGNEEEVAAGIARWLKEDPVHNKREDVIYTTKIYDPDHGYDKTKKAAELSLERAKAIGYIDIILMHSPQSDDKRRHGSWTALQEFVDAGRVKQLGVSNYGIKHLEQLFAYPDLKYKPVLNQIQLHPWVAQPALVAWCKAHNIVLEAYSPLAQGAKLDDPDLVKIAQKYSKTTAQVLLRWSTQNGFVPIPRASTQDMIDSDLDIFSFELDKDDLDVLASKDGRMEIKWWNPPIYPLDSEKEPGKTYPAGSWEVLRGIIAQMRKDEREEKERAGQA